MLRRLLYSAFGSAAKREVDAFHQASAQPRQQQTALLLDILSRNQDTQYGRQHGFSAIKDVSDFQRAVPINEYDSLKPYIERIARGDQSVLTAEPAFMFATTSGTTGARKLIPITRAYVKEFRKASVVSGYHLLQSFPAVVNGVSLSVFSSAEEGRTEGGIPFGAISGRLYLEEPKLVKRYISPLPYDVFVIEDYESRYYTLLRSALMMPVSIIYTLNPSTIALLGRRLSFYAPQLIKDIADGTLTPPGAVSSHTRATLKRFLRPHVKRAAALQKLLDADGLIPPRVWPQLSLISCWTKAAAAFYIKDFPEMYPQVPVCDITYGASEGRGTVCLGPDKQALAVRSHFFEFVPEAEMGKSDAPVLTADELELGQSYFILFTTSGGLYRYNINDIVRVVGWHQRTPLLEFLHKGGNISSFTGEKVTESQITQAATAALNETKQDVLFFTVVPEFKPEPHYQLWVETKSPLAAGQADRLADCFDRQLGICNVEYQTKRSSKRLAPVVVRPLSPGTYEDLRQQMVGEGVPDAQIKISHLNPKDQVKSRLQSHLRPLSPY